MADANATAFKRCSRCLEDVPVGNFYRHPTNNDGLQGKCKPCHKEYASEWRRINSEKVKAFRQDEYKRGRDQRAREGRKPRRRFPDGYSHRERLRVKWREQTKRRNADPKMRAVMNVKNVLRATVTGERKTSRWFDVLGYSREEFLKHLEMQFVDGMTWDNYGQWHIDHIVPLASFSITGPDDPELIRAWCLTNLRPLWAIDNLRKGAGLTHLV